MSFVFRIVLLTLVAVSCLGSTSFSAPVVLFDEAHKQQFKIGGAGQLDLSDLATYYTANGFSVESSDQPLSADVLASADVLVLSGPFQPLSAQELDAVMNFVKSGGGLAVLLHIAPPMRDLLIQLEVDFTNGTLREVNQVIGDNPLDFKVSSLADHPVTRGLKSFSVYGSWALRGTADNVIPLAQTSKHGWVDLDRDNRPSQADAMQQFAVMVGGELGQGRFVVLGDDAVFQNRFFDEDNRQLALQLVNWLANGK